MQPVNPGLSTVSTSRTDEIEAAHLVLPLTPDAPLPHVANSRSASRLLHFLGLDRAVVFTVLARGWSSVAGILTLAFIARFLTRVEQGYYYTFYSLVALQMIFELGFSVVVLQTASHEAAHLTIAPDGRVTGPLSSHSRLASILQKATGWYTAGALLMICVLLPLGIRFFGATSRATGTHPVHWLGAWCLVVIASGFTFQVDPTFSFLEGCGFVSDVARVRLVQAVIGTLLGWSALLLHHGLLAPGMMIAGQAVVGLTYVVRRRGLLLPLLAHDPGDFSLTWKSEIWPFQWRIAVSWICGYFITQLFTPVLFRFRGAAGVIEAGQMGMSISICGTLTAVAIAWMNTKAAPLGSLIARRDYAGLDAMFFRALKQSLSAATLAAAAVWLTIFLLRLQHVSFALRLLPPIPLGLLLLATIANILVFAEAVYLRAHKQEKFMLISVLGAFWMTPATFLLGRRFGPDGITVGYLLGTLFIGVGFGTYTFAKFRRTWHV